MYKIYHEEFYKMAAANKKQLYELNEHLEEDCWYTVWANKL